VVENLCHDELQLLNRGVGHLLGQPELETRQNPFAPAAIVDAFADSLQTIKTEPGVRFAILKELNRASLAEVNAIYADLNKHLQNLHVMPAGISRPLPIRRSGGRSRAKADADAHAAKGEGADASNAEAAPAAEIDLMELFRRRFGSDAPAGIGPVASTMPTQGWTGAPGMEGMGTGRPPDASGMPGLPGRVRAGLARPECALAAEHRPPTAASPFPRFL